jgi:glycosyltransferase 2 family protein
MSQQSQTDLIKKLKPARIIIPIIIGLAVVAWLILKEINTDALSQLKFTWKSVFWLFIAFLFLVFRTWFYMIRIRVLTDNDLSWRQSFRVIMLWEFTSAITPSTVGGTAFAVVFLNKEGISVGRSTSVVLATSFLDELYFVFMFPLLLLVIGGKAIFITSLHNAGTSIMNNLVSVAIIGYVIILAWVVLVGYGLFVNPVAIKNLINNFFRFPFLRRWKGSALKAGNDIVESSNDLKKKSFGFWLKALVTTFISWTSRYWVVNAILLAFFVINDHLLIFARQLVLWIMMIISPTPGGSGFAELILGKYISDLIPVNLAVAGSLALAMALIWRIISYYPFLIIGAIIVPGWIERKFIPTIVKKK